MQNNSISPNHEHSNRETNQKGFTLVELVITMIIFLIVTSAVYGVLNVARRSRTTVSQQVQMTKNVRLSLNLLGRDTYNAGFGYPLKFSVNVPDDRMTTLISQPNDANTYPDVVPPIIAGNDLNPNTFNTVAGTTTDQVTFLFKDSTFNLIGDPDKEESKALNVTTGTISGVNQVTITGGTSAPCNINDIFVIAGDSGSALGVATDKAGNVVKFADVANDSLNFNQDGTTAPIALITGNASMHRVKLVTYFVTADGVLTRREFANVPPPSGGTSAAIVDEPLVYDVENFQIQYILDDGTVSDNPIAGNAVRQIRFAVSTRTTELNAVGQPYRVTMTSTFGTRNLGYDAN